MTPWLTVIGLGEDGFGALAGEQQGLIEDAALLIGGERHLAMVPDTARGERLRWRRPLLDTMRDIEVARGRKVVVLATGDPMSYGIGATLARRFSPDEMRVVPAVGAFDLACARLGWHREEVARLTLHGRPLDQLRRHLAPGRRILVLSEDGATPRQAASLLCELGYGRSAFHVLERLGGTDEQIYAATAETWTGDRTDDLNTIAVGCVAGPEAVILPLVPGLPDDVFAHDGQLTKRVVRAATVAALAPLPDTCLWDLGAGCGSVAIEWLRAVPDGRAHAVERVAARCEMIGRNASGLGVPQLDVVHGEIEHMVADLPPPDAVFIGGGLTASVVESVWDRLAAGGRLVANAVTLQGEGVLLQAHSVYGGDLVRIGVTHAAAVGDKTGWRPAMPVTQWSVLKT